MTRTIGEWRDKPHGFGHMRHATLRLRERFGVTATVQQAECLSSAISRAELPHLGSDQDRSSYWLLDLKRWFPGVARPNRECVAVFSADTRCIVTVLTGRQFRRTFNLHPDAPLREVPFGSSPRRGKPTNLRKVAP